MSYCTLEHEKTRAIRNEHEGITRQPKTRVKITSSTNNQNPFTKVLEKIIENKR